MHLLKRNRKPQNLKLKKRWQLEKCIIKTDDHGYKRYEISRF